MESPAIEQQKGTMEANLSFQEYLKEDAISKHGLDQLHQSPSHFLYKKSNPSAPNSSQALGVAVHALVLEPDSFSSQFAIAPDVNKRTKVGKAQWTEFEEDNQGKTIISQDDYETARSMSTNVLNHSRARILLASGIPEVSLLWKDEETEVNCKGRVDWICEKRNVLVDLKTTRNASPKEFARDCGKYRYHCQDAFYTAGVQASGLDKPDFVFICVENTPPFDVAVYTLDEPSRNAGHEAIFKDLQRYAECKKNNRWPGYPQNIQVLNIPRWALN
ncbi:MAG: PD-(D/E)XK nuclease-like domain-containing protein [Candidatus Thiodiazotropha lotti]|nr:PD-(D/E)XK nuclease-like domain-containing protein [Candidatus Thiodiazotropha lotti]